jgi:hypothetical protein
MAARQARGATRGWAVACVLLSAVIVVEWQGIEAAPGTAAQAGPAPADPSPPAGKSGSGQPLGPLQSYAAVTARPLFTQSRRPPATVDGTVLAAVEGNLFVAGILLSGGERIALVRQSTDRKAVPVREGQAVGGWTIRSISADGVILAGQGGETTLPLQKRQGVARAAGR